MLDSKKVFIFGYSGHAYVIIESLLAAGYLIAGYFDYQEAPLNPYQLHYCGFEENVDIKSIVKENYVFPSVGDNKIRRNLVSFFESNRLNQCILVDPSANISPTVIIDTSTYIGKNVTLNAQSQIGKGVIINTGAIIDHECDVQNFSHIAPAAILCGNVRIGENSFIGANVIVRNNTSICSDVILGAGSVVVKSIEEKGIWVGNPSKKIK